MQKREKMEKIIDFYEKRIKIILGIILGVCILNCIICICKDIKVSETLLGFGISIVFFFIAWAMVFIVLGFHKISPFCPKSIFKFFCYFFIIVSTIGIIFGIINDTIICLLKNKNDIFPFAYSTCPLGFVYGNIFLYRKTFGKDKEIEVKTNIEITDETKKKKIIKCVVIFGIGFIGAIIVCTSIFSLFKNSEPYKYSLELIENNQDAMEYLGEKYKLPIIISGSMSMNGNGMGQASLSYKIKGKNGISRVYIDAEKENGIWKYNKVIFYKEKGKADSIDLLLNKE